MPVTLTYKDGTTNTVPEADVSYWKSQGWNDTPAMSPQDAANAAKYSTPPPPNDPASKSGARANELYIGPTNFSNLQKQYTPYQLEQATVRDASGNISWKQGVDISKVPTAPPTTPFTPPATPPPATTDNVSGTATATAPTVTKDTSPMDAFALAQSEAAKTYLTGIKSAMDGLLAKQQEMETAAKKAAEEKVNTLKGRLTSILDTTASQDALKADRELFKVKQSIETLGVINQKIADASAALDQGILYEQNQPVRMALLTGRSAALQRQGIASIGALKMSAEVVKNNLDLARVYADDTIAAIKQDNAERRSALNTLLDLENANLVKLSADEKATITQRQKLLDDESNAIEKRKDDLFDLASKYPHAFAQGGATFMDTREQALAKMLPTMSTEEKQKYDLEIQQKQLDLLKTKADIAKAGRTGTGGGGGGTGGALVEKIANDVELLKGAIDPATGKPYTPDKIRTELLKEYGGQMKLTELNSVVDQTLQGQKSSTDVAAVRDEWVKQGLLHIDPTSSSGYAPTTNAQQIREAISAGLVEFDPSSGMYRALKDSNVGFGGARRAKKDELIDPADIQGVSTFGNLKLK